jgi:peptidoglycan-N-acetylmuramic acid deacetylase
MIQGHTIGSHTWSHKDLNISSPEVIRQEVTQLSEALVTLNILEQPPTFLRPPYGLYNDEVIQIVASELNYTIVNWSIETMDWAHPGDTAAGLLGYSEVLNGTDPDTTLGFISLHHDVHPGSQELAFEAIDYTRAQGYRMVSLEECLGISVTPPKPYQKEYD